MVWGSTLANNTTNAWLLFISAPVQLCCLQNNLKKNFFLKFLVLDYYWKWPFLQGLVSKLKKRPVYFFHKSVNACATLIVFNQIYGYYLVLCWNDFITKFLLFALKILKMVDIQLFWLADRVASNWIWGPGGSSLQERTFL